MIADAGFKNAMALKWIGIDKSSGTPCVVRKVTTVDDTITPQLTSIVNGTTPTDEQITYLGKRRKLISLTTWRAYLVVKGDSFALQRVKPATDLTEDLLVDDAWRSRQFKEYNFHALGIPTSGGYLHPLLKVSGYVCGGGTGVYCVCMLCVYVVCVCCVLGGLRNNVCCIRLAGL